MMPNRSRSRRWIAAIASSGSFPGSIRACRVAIALPPASSHTCTWCTSTTPIPAYGFLMYLPRQDAMPLDMSVEDGMKLVISGGIVVPPGRVARPQRPAPAPVSARGQKADGVVALEEVEQHT